MSSSARRKSGARQPDAGRALGRGLHARRGVRLTLRVLREAAGKTQVDVAEAARMDQGDVSRLERRESFDDCQLATLRRYIEAVGGELEVTARFGTKRISIVGSTSGEER